MCCCVRFVRVRSCACVCADDTQACVAYTFISIPSMDDPFAQLYLYIYAGQVRSPLFHTTGPNRRHNPHRALILCCVVS